MPGHETFLSCASRLTQELQEQTGMACFAVSRLAGGQQTFLYKKVAHAALHLEPSVPYRDSICATMLELGGPHAVDDLLDEPAYARTRLATTMPAAAFISAPINIKPTSDRGALFGTLCGFDPNPRVSMARHLPEIERCAEQLSTLLDFELDVADESRRRAQGQLFGGVATRRSWYEALKAENDRSWRYGDISSVLVVETPDQLLDQTIDLILGLTRPMDLVAAVNAGSLAILAPLCDARHAQLLMRKIAVAAGQRGLEIGTGYATQEAKMTADQTWLKAAGAVEPLTEPRSRRLAHAI